MKNSKKVFLKITLLILLFNGVEVFSFESNIDTSYDSTKYSLNKMQIENSADTVSFLAGGHLYGSPRWKGSLFPSPSILGNIETFNSMGIDFFMGLGDIVVISKPPRLKVLDNFFIKKLNMPFYNAVGNHDLSSSYKEYFKLDRLYGYFTKGKNIFIFLDTETIKGEIGLEQLAFLKDTLTNASLDKNIKNIFIFSHKLIWAYGLKERYNLIYEHVNATTGYQKNDHFKRDIFPLLMESKKKIYWISGDIGVDWTLPAFYDQYNEQITFMAVGLGDTKDDMLLKVDIDKSENVQFSLLSLIDTNQTFDLQKFTIEY